MSSYMFDTSLFIDCMKKPPEPEAVRLLNEVLSGQSAASCSPITEAELWIWDMTREQEVVLTGLLRACAPVPLTSGIARSAGQSLRKMSEGERRSHFPDALIVASAVARGEMLVTSDRAIQRVFGNPSSFLVYERAKR